jgi:ABC-type multidrug transport system ATPase subunit
MEIIAKDLGKRFNFNWLFRQLNLHAPEGSRYAVLGSNGSGKSTLLQIISGATLPSSGEIIWNYRGKSIDSEQIYQYTSLAAPYLELIEDFSLREHLDFHFSLKPMLSGFSMEDLMRISNLETAADRQIRYYSSGMKQRVRLLLAVCSDCPLLLLDEPLSNLDEAGCNWYLDLIERFGKNRTIWVASNHQLREYSFCESSIILGTHS